MINICVPTKSLSLLKKNLSLTATECMQKSCRSWRDDTFPRQYALWIQFNFVSKKWRSHAGVSILNSKRAIRFQFCVQNEALGKYVYIDCLWNTLKHARIQFVCVICCHSKLMWFRTQDWHLSSMHTKHTPTTWIYMFKHIPTCHQCHQKNLSFLSLSLPISKQSDTVTKLSRALAHGNTWTWIHWQRHEPEWCLSLTATRTLTLDHQARTVETCTQGLNIAVSPNKSLSLFPVFFSRSLSQGSCKVCSGCKTRLLENMFIVFSEAHKNIPWFHTCCSQMLTVEVLSSTSIKFQGLMSDLAGCTPVWPAGHYWSLQSVCEREH